MQEITINPQEIMEFVIKYSPYFGIYFLNQSIKSWLKLKKDRVFPVVFLVSCVVAFAQMVIEKAVYLPLEFGCWVLLRGLSLGAASWLSWWIIKMIFYRKKD